MSVESYRERVVRGPVVRTVLRLGLPLVAAQLVQVLYNVADAFWLGRRGPGRAEAGAGGSRSEPSTAGYYLREKPGVSEEG